MIIALTHSYIMVPDPEHAYSSMEFEELPFINDATFLKLQHNVHIRGFDAMTMSLV